MANCVHKLRLGSISTSMPCTGTLCLRLRHKCEGDKNMGISYLLRNSIKSNETIKWDKFT